MRYQTRTDSPPCPHSTNHSLAAPCTALQPIEFSISVLPTDNKRLVHPTITQPTADFYSMF
ncbi:hypothetical protein [Rubritalea tangerina]|uniref:hypothetical protein n=1 Tax=Rubritalea tangerina TaxID=430798 RepID=UPI003620ED31